MFSISSIPTWIIVIAVILIALMILFRSRNHVYFFSIAKKYLFYSFLILILALFVISVMNIHKSHDFDYKSLDGWKVLVKVYLSWFGGIISNIGKVTGYAIQQNWVASGNSTG